MEDYGATGGGKYAGSAPKITAAPTAKLTFDQPRISTTSGATGIATPYAGGNASPITAPAYTSGGSPGRYGTAPAPQIAPPPAPAPPMPPPDGLKARNAMDDAGRAAQDQSWLGGDSDYTAQIGEYDRALQTFIDRIAGQKKMFNQDATDATNSTNLNQSTSTNALGEDFGARGLSYSGLAVDSQDKTNARFNEAKGQIGKVLARNNSDADNRQADYQTENSISKGNAERSSLNRQAQRQALLDSMAGF